MLPTPRAWVCLNAASGGAEDDWVPPVRHFVSFGLGEMAQIYYYLFKFRVLMRDVAGSLLKCQWQKDPCMQRGSHGPRQPLGVRFSSPGSPRKLPATPGQVLIMHHA